MSENTRNLLKLIEKHKRMTNKQLCECLNISQSTLRRGLILLEREGHIRRTRGGVILEVTQNQQISAAYRGDILSVEKKYIAEIASIFIGEGMSLFFDSSGTVDKLVPLLKNTPRLTVLNSGLMTAYKLIELPLVEGKVFILGGEVCYDGASVLGLYENSLINQMKIDLSFISPTGIDENGIYFANYSQMLLAQKMINQSESSIIVVDHTKFDKTYAYQIKNMNNFEAIITDRKPSDIFIKTIKSIEGEILY